MTAREWLAERQPAQPPVLAQRIVELLSNVTASEDIPTEFLSAAEYALRSILDAGSDSRESAVDVLAIDALVTYAFEAAAADPKRVPALAAQAMSRLSHAIPLA